MRSEQKRPHYRRSLGAFIVLSTVAMGCIGVVAPGCGGGGSATISSEGGTDGTAPYDGATDTSTSDHSVGDASTDSPTSSDAPEETEPTTESGAETGTEAGSEGGTTACTGSETACTTGTTNGLCVSGICEPCNSPADNGNCATAYGDGGSLWVCAASGSCVPGDCTSDADCTTGGVDEICGITTPNVCGPCTSDTQCQDDPNYGPSTVCDTASGATQGGCVPATCSAKGACTTNASDFCCATGGTADCTGSGCSCVPGNCCTDADCSGELCGAGGPNTCGKCTTDAQCQNDPNYGPTTICDTTTGSATLGQCIAANTAGNCSGTPGATGGAPGTCSVNTADMCCAQHPCIPGTGADACCPGTAGNTYCATLLNNNSASCDATAYVCTACAGITNNTYTVDPVNGSDATGTGSGLSTGGTANAACSLKTIKRALQLIGTASVATTIQVVGGEATGPSTASGETFPITVPENVTITTVSGSGAATVTVAAGDDGFHMNAPLSAIQGNTGAALTITTTANGATNGVVVGGNAGNATGATSLSNVTITGFLDSGIVVNGGVLTINPGVQSNANGTASSGGHGLDVTAGEAIITGSATATTTFNENTAHGILVQDTGLISLTGTVTAGASGEGTVETNGNTAAGVWIQQTPNNGLQGSTITGLVSFANTAGNGMRIVAGSMVTVRNSVFLGNKGNGVIISAGTGATATSSMAGIDLGDTTTNGGNTFQAPLGSGNNTASGICIDVANGQAALLAVGNQFQATNCATTAATLYLNTKGCTNSAAQCSTGVCDLGLENPVSAVIPSNNTFNVSKCTQ